MSVESASDLLDIIEALGGIDAESVTVTHAGGSFSAIFERPFVEVEAGGMGVESRQPVLVARTSDVSALAKDTSLTVQSVAYKLRRQEPDGTGVTRLILKTA
jgi:hypothetical protein